MPGKAETRKVFENAAEQPERYPFAVRLYGVLSILSGSMQVALVVLIVLALIAFVAVGDQVELPSANSLNINTTSLVIGIVSGALSIVLAGMFVVLGVRLLRGTRKRAALIANIMIALEAATGVCQFMLYGIGARLIPVLVNAVILVALQTYSDPSLREERQLQRKLR